MSWTEEQTYAIGYPSQGNLALNALAGTGKTTVLIGRIYHLLHQGVPASQILMLTFSRRGAKDMRVKAEKIGLNFRRQFRTLHSMAYQMLREKFGDEKELVVPKTWQMLKVIRDTLKKFPSVKKSKRNPRGLTPSDVMQEILGAKTKLVWPDEWVDKSTGQIFPSFAEHLGTRFSSMFVRALTACYRSLEAACANPHFFGFNAIRERWLPFSSMIAVTARDILEGRSKQGCWTHSWTGRYSHVIVDEAQDNNYGQWVLSKHLCGEQLIVCGDVSQSIFQFRGAEPSFLENYLQRDDFAVAPLTKNWRSGSAILDTANRVLSCVERVRDDTLKVGREGHEGDVQVDGLANPREEAEFIVDTVEKLTEDGLKYSDMAVLYRVNAYSAAIELEFIRRGIMCRIAGSSFFNKAVVRLGLDYLRCALNPDDEAVFRRIYCKPLRGLGKAFLAKVPSYEVLKTAIVEPRWSKSAGEFRHHLDTVGNMLKDDQPLGVVLQYVFNTVGLREFYRDEEAGLEDVTETDEICKALVECANRITDVNQLLNMAALLAGYGDEGEEMDLDAVTLSTVHKCVSPDTWIETPEGLMQMRDVAVNTTGIVGTADGPRAYTKVFRYPKNRALRITTKDGYEVTVTEDHKMMAWTGSGYEAVAASDLHKGQFLRLRLGESCVVHSHARLPGRPEDLDVRCKPFDLPECLDSEDFAEFLGMMTADGTVYRRGFRYTKKHADLADAVASAVESHFGVKPKRWSNGVSHFVEVNSVGLAAWMRSVGGLEPHRKRVPSCVLRSPLNIQAAFLRGLFEDGTVNTKNGKLDHIAWSNCGRDIVALVQVMLLRFGVISSRRNVRGQWRLYVYGNHAEKYVRRVGFLSLFNRAKVTCGYRRETGCAIPVDKSAIRMKCDYTSRHWAAQNARYRGTVSRAGAGLLGLDDCLGFHHDRISKIDIVESASMCLEVPVGGRFLQNGFDGSNSKGLEWPVVFCAGVSSGVFPHKRAPREEELRLGYVAFTRARDILHITYTQDSGPSELVAAACAVESLEVK